MTTKEYINNTSSSRTQRKKVFIWGFCDDLSDIIINLQNEKHIDIRMWIGTPLSANHHTCYDIFSFFSDHWIDRYKDVYIKYTKNLKTNHAIYNSIYQYLYKYIDMASRHDKLYQTQDIHYYINNFNLLYNFFYAFFLKENIQSAIFSNIPHEGPDLIAYQICKILNIQTIILNQHPYIPNLIMYMFNIEDYGNFPYYYKYKKNDVKISDRLTKNFFYMNIKNKELDYAYNIIRALNNSKNIRSCIHNLLDVSKKLIRIYKYKNNIERYSSNCNLTELYCYFPLHFQPELTTSALGGIYTDQLLAIQQISELIPDNWFIYVKEHPMQTEFMRSPIFFKRLLTIPKVILIKNKVSTYQLIEHSQFTATITGTVGWESITSGKNTLIFGNIWYKNLPGVFTYNKNITIREILSYRINHDELEKKLNKMIGCMWPGVIDDSYQQIVENYSHKMNNSYISSLLQKMLYSKPIIEHSTN